MTESMIMIDILYLATATFVLGMMCRGYTLAEENEEHSVSLLILMLGTAFGFLGYALSFDLFARQASADGLGFSSFIFSAITFASSAALALTGWLTITLIARLVDKLEVMSNRAA